MQGGVFGTVVWLVDSVVPQCTFIYTIMHGVEQPVLYLQGGLQEAGREGVY